MLFASRLVMEVLHCASYAYFPQVVGNADTGVDWDSCFFHDSSVALPVNRVDPSHRKIIAYYARTPNDTKDLDGHGTHIAGSLYQADARGNTARDPCCRPLLARA